jgi:gas vesicle protein
LATVLRRGSQPFGEQGQEKGVMVMKEELSNRKNSIVIPALVGSALGAGTGFLLAPKSGKELRKDLKRFARKTEKQVAEVIDGGRELYGEGMKVVAKAVDASKKIYDEGSERLDLLVHKKGKSSSIVPILAGGIIGAGIALLLAPKSGKAVREDIKRIAADTGDKVDSLIDQGKVLYTEGTTKAKDLGRKVFHEVEKNIKHAA